MGVTYERGTPIAVAPPFMGAGLSPGLSSVRRMLHTRVHNTLRERQPYRERARERERDRERERAIKRAINRESHRERKRERERERERERGQNERELPNKKARGCVGLMVEKAHARPFVGASQGRSWNHWVVLVAILWEFIAKN